MTYNKVLSQLRGLNHYRPFGDNLIVEISDWMAKESPEWEVATNRWRIKRKQLLTLI